MRDYPNPFTPTFGEIPAHIAGREQVVSDIERALSSDTRRPELTTLFSGARGTGKTTLLSLLGSRSESLGWVCVSTTAVPGMLEDIEVQALKRSAHLVGAQTRTRVSVVGIPQVLEVGISDAQTPSNWRSRMEDLLEQLHQQGAGLLITVDEIDPSLQELIQLVTAYQHFVRDNRKVGLLLAGLPHSVSSILNDKTVSFLRRAQLTMLEPIPDQDVNSALRKTIEENGRYISDTALDMATSAIRGFPFLLQLVGYRAWDRHPVAEEISDDDVVVGIEYARADLRVRVFDATYRELSPGDIDFLAAMAEDTGDSAIADIVERTGKSPSMVSQHRRRLIDAGVIGERRRGVVGFDLPFFREFLLQELGL